MGAGAAKDEDSRFDGVLGPSQGIGLPAVRTLSDEYRDTPEPADSEWVPPPVAPSLGRRVADRLAKARAHARRANR